MKKLFFILLMGISGVSISMQMVNLNESTYTCNDQVINSHTSVSWLIKNCKNVKVKTDNVIINGEHSPNRQKGNIDDAMDTTAAAKAVLNKVWFYTDDGRCMICYYKNNQLIRCKVKVVKHTSSAAIPHKLP